MIADLGRENVLRREEEVNALSNKLDFDKNKH